MDWGLALALGIPAVGGLLSGDGGRSEATAQQAAFNKKMLEMLNRRENIELPFRQNLLGALKSRSEQRFPTFKLPKKPPTFNPFKRTAADFPGFGAFQEAFGTADSQFDLDNSGEVDFQDFLAGTARGPGGFSPPKPRGAFLSQKATPRSGSAIVRTPVSNVDRNLIQSLINQNPDGSGAFLESDKKRVRDIARSVAIPVEGRSSKDYLLGVAELLGIIPQTGENGA